MNQIMTTDRAPLYMDKKVLFYNPTLYCMSSDNCKMQYS